MKKINKTSFLLTLLLVGLISCVDLKHVNDFSSASKKSIEKFEEINYSFKESCSEKCEYKKVIKFSLDETACDCKLDEKADSITLLIYNTIRGYFDGLASISNNELTSYKLDELTKTLVEGDFGNIKLDKEIVKSSAKISEILLKAISDKYREKQIKKYVIAADTSINVLISFLDFNLSENLIDKLDNQKKRIKEDYFDLVKDKSLSTMEKRKAVEEYFARINEIDLKQNQLRAYSKALKKIAEGHRKLAKDIKKIKKDAVRKALIQYASDIQDIITEFNKLKK